MMARKKTISVVIPAFNEAASIADLLHNLKRELSKRPEYAYEILAIDDGSTDATAEIVRNLIEHEHQLQLICLSRNFGKEIATTAGIQAASGDAIITIDADGQHPTERIPAFIDKWEGGAKVVVGIRAPSKTSTKELNSKLFYRIFNRLSGIKLVPGSTDFRLIDKQVQQEFVKMTERNRITRGLIDWLGFRREFVEFEANPRVAGTPSYSFKKLMQLAVDSIVSLSVSPLYITAYLGLIVLPISVILALVMAVDKLASDPLHLHLTGGAFVIIFMLFLIGVLMMSQGILGLYLSHIHAETQNRPLFVIDTERSVRTRED